MTLTTERENVIALPGDIPAASIYLAFAQIACYIENHAVGCPDMGDLVVAIHPQGSTSMDRIAFIHDFAAFFGVEVTYRYGTYFAHRRFSQPGARSVTLECHHTPDPDFAHRMHVDAQAAEQARELDGADAA